MILLKKSIFINLSFSQKYFYDINYEYIFLIIFYLIKLEILTKNDLFHIVYFRIFTYYIKFNNLYLLFSLINVIILFLIENIFFV